jgi:hypothetical protein
MRRASVNLFHAALGTTGAEGVTPAAELERLQSGIRYYIHVTEPHVMTGFERFLNYHAGKLVDAIPKHTDRVR